MRKFLLIAASLVFVSGVVAAQHHNLKENPVKGDIVVSTDVTIGTSVLKAGTYRYKCDRQTIAFSDSETGKPVLKVPCKGRELSEPSTETALHVKTDASGKRVVAKLLLKGSNIEHVF